MKGFSRLFCFCCLSFVAKILVNGSISDPIPGISTDITTNYCSKNHSLDFNPTLESAVYISDQDRYNLCKKEFSNFDEDKNIDENYKQCLGPFGQKAASLNPCAVVCPQYEYRISKVSEVDNELAKQTCKRFLTEYNNDRSFRIESTNQRCGPNNRFCDKHGCCIKRETISSTTEKTIQTESTTSPTSTTLRTTETTPKATPTTSTTSSKTTTSSQSTIIETTRQPTTIPTTFPTTNSSLELSLSPSTLTTVTHRQNHCQSVGLFKDPTDPTERRYLSCVLKAVLRVCPIGQIFDRNESRCVHTETQPPTTVTMASSTDTTSSVTTTPAIDWNKYFKCTKEGFFRNPYDCNGYFWCYKNQGDNTTIRFASFHCAVNQVWDENQENEEGKEKGTCVRVTDYRDKYHHSCETIPFPPFFLSFK